MALRENENLTIPEALETLKEYSCTIVKDFDISETEKEKLRRAILSIVSVSESMNIGICADNADMGFAALRSYLKAFGYEFNLDRASSNSLAPVYIKFNTERMSDFVDSYSGYYRGVLVSCRGQDETIVGTYGHFPLDLFD